MGPVAHPVSGAWMSLRPLSLLALSLLATVEAGGQHSEITSRNLVRRGDGLGAVSTVRCACGMTRAPHKCDAFDSLRTVPQEPLLSVPTAGNREAPLAPPNFSVPLRKLRRTEPALCGLFQPLLKRRRAEREPLLREGRRRHAPFSNSARCSRTARELVAPAREGAPTSCRGCRLRHRERSR